MKSSKSGDEGSAQANNKPKTSKSGDEGSAQANNKPKTSKSGDEGSAQSNKAPSNTTNKGASKKMKTSTTNTGKEPAPKEPVSSNDNTKLINSDTEAFLMRVGGRTHRKRQQVSPGVSKGTDIVSGDSVDIVSGDSVDIVSGDSVDTVIGDEGLVKTTSHKHKLAKSGVSPGNKAKVSSAQPPSETVKNSQPVTNKASAEQSSPPPPPPPETKSRNNAKLVNVNQKLVMQATPVQNVKQAQKCKTTVEHEPLPAKKGKSKVKAEPKEESLKLKQKMTRWHPLKFQARARLKWGQLDHLSLFSVLNVIKYLVPWMS